MGPLVSEQSRSTRLTSGDYYADIIDARVEPPIFHWIVQRLHDSEILQWGHENSFAEAEDAAQKNLQWFSLQDGRVALG